MKPAKPELITDFNICFQTAKKYRKVPADYTVDIGRLEDLLGVYNITTTAKNDPILKSLQDAVKMLFYPKRSCFIGPIGAVSFYAGTKQETGKSSEIARISVTPYRSGDAPAVWSDITFYDAKGVDRIKKCGLVPGDVLCFSCCYPRKPYKGKAQYSGMDFHLIGRKSDK